MVWGSTSLLEPNHTLSLRNQFKSLIPGFSSCSSSICLSCLNPSSEGISFVKKADKWIFKEMAKRGMSCSVSVFLFIKVLSLSRRISIEFSTRNFRGYFWCKAQPRGAVAVLVGIAFILRSICLSRISNTTLVEGRSLTLWQIWWSITRRTPWWRLWALCCNSSRWGAEATPELCHLQGLLLKCSFSICSARLFLFWGKKWAELHEMDDKVI